MTGKNEEILQEVIDEIDSALKDPKGIILHQRRLAFALSLGTIALIEDYLTKKNVLKPAAKINHLWLKKKKENVKKIISKIVTCPIDNLEKLDNLLDLAFEIEKERNELAYGKNVNEKKLKQKIDSFLNLKKEAENV
jgi:hypothetical protein